MFTTICSMIVAGMLLAALVGHLARLRADRLWDEREAEAARRRAVPAGRFPWHR